MAVIDGCIKLLVKLTLIHVVNIMVSCWRAHYLLKEPTAQNTWLLKVPRSCLTAFNFMLNSLVCCRRARYLLEGAQHIMDKLGGKFPETAAEVSPGPAPDVRRCCCIQ
jgi:hypothetical protein